MFGRFTSSGFLEVAEYLNIKGLSEGNMGGIVSSKEDISTFKMENIDQSPKGKRTAESIIDNYFVEQPTWPSSRDR